MKVPEHYEDCRVIYYVPFTEPQPGGWDAPDSIAIALVECPLAEGSYSRKSFSKRHPPSVPTQLFAIEVDENGQPIRKSDYWHENEAAFFKNLARWGSELPVLKPGDEIPERGQAAS